MKGSLFCLEFFFFNIILMCKYIMKCEIVKHSVGGGNAHNLVFKPLLNKPKRKKKKKKKSVKGHSKFLVFLKSWRRL